MRDLGNKKESECEETWGWPNECEIMPQRGTRDMSRFMYILDQWNKVDTTIAFTNCLCVSMWLVEEFFSLWNLELAGLQSLSEI